MADLPAPKPFYRSRLFWLGMPGFVFLSWLWVCLPDSSGSVTLQTSGSHSFNITNSIKGQIGFACRTLPEGDSYPRWDLRVFRIASYENDLSRDGFVLRDHTTRIASAGQLRTDTSDGRRTELWVANWLLVGAYGSVWMGVAGGWQRRKVRLMNAPAAGIVDPPARSST
jgi:hypothetical protein